MKANRGLIKRESGSNVSLRQTEKERGRDVPQSRDSFENGADGLHGGAVQREQAGKAVAHKLSTGRARLEKEVIPFALPAAGVHDFRNLRTDAQRASLRHLPPRTLVVRLDKGPPLVQDGLATALHAERAQCRV